MSFIKLVRKRRSIRKYQPKEVPEDIIKELLEAARLAPSGCNAQPWKYIIIKNKETIHQLREKEIFWQDFIYNIPLLIIGCGNPSKYKTNLEGIESQIEDGIQPKDGDKRIESIFSGDKLIRTTRDVAISMMQMAYRAQELSLGACFVGCFYKEKLKEFLNLPKNLEPILSLSVGYAAESPQPRPRKPLDKIIYKII